MGDAARTRAALSFVCCALHKAGIRYVDAECLRLAKHADVSVGPVMWALLADLLEFQQASAQTGWTPLLRESVAELSGLQKEVAVFRLMLLGYPRADSLGDSSDTRELLLAVGFLLSTSEILTAARSIKSCHPLPPYPHDIAGLDRVSASPGRQSPSGARLYHHILQLHGRWHAEVRRLEHLESHRLSLLKQIQNLASHRLQSLDMADKRKTLQPPTQYELYVLERSLLQEHVQDLQQSIGSLQASKVGVLTNDCNPPWGWGRLLVAGKDAVIGSRDIEDYREY